MTEEPKTFADLTGRVAFITGCGSPTGIGFATARALGSQGASVAICSTTGRINERAEELGAMGIESSAHVADLTSPAEAERSVAEAIDAHGGIDILVNNAGHGQVVPLALMEEEDWDNMMSTHLKGAFLCTQAVLRGMVKRRAGRIINVSSLAGVKMMEAPVHYATAKAGLKGFTESLAKEIGRYGITVNAVAPGILDEGVSDNLPEARKEEYLRHCAMRRVGTLEEAAEVVAFIASDRASYMNGATVIIDGAV